MTAHNGRGIWMRVIALIAIGFGLMTIREGGAVLGNQQLARRVVLVHPGQDVKDTARVDLAACSGNVRPSRDGESYL